MKTVGVAEMNALKKYVKKNRPSVVSKEYQLDILMLQGKIRFENEEKQKILSPG